MAWADVDQNIAPSLNDHVLGLDAEGTLVLTPTNNLLGTGPLASKASVDALRLSGASSGSVTLLGLKAGAVVGILACYGGGTGTGTALTVAANGVQFATWPVSNLLTTALAVTDPSSGFVVSVATLSTNAPLAMSTTYTVPADGDYIFAVGAPGSPKSILALVL